MSGMITKLVALLAGGVLVVSCGGNTPQGDSDPTVAVKQITLEGELESFAGSSGVITVRVNGRPATVKGKRWQHTVSVGNDLANPTPESVRVEMLIDDVVVQSRDVALTAAMP